MGGEVLVLGIIAMGTWLIPFFGLPIPIIGLAWGIMLLRRRPARKGMTISGIVLSSIGLFLSVSYTIISLVGSPPDIFNVSNGQSGLINLPAPGSVDWKADGKIESGEYENSESSNSGFQVFWRTDSQFVYLGFSAPTEGWVAISFIDDLRSGGMDTIAGYADVAAQGHIFDLWSATQPNGVSQNDDQQGGQLSLLDWAVLTTVDDEDETTSTVVEFRRRITTGDAYDIQLLPGPNLFIWSFGTTDDIKTSPSDKGYGVIELD
ncbi:DOMON domain-containing protein [Dehalogenimonas sp. THU2]|uniref:DOMON domain-containing protein n=1 Tax=Dehalogenimonas sp. THU2 TaxID=3151121 RepID=UPI003218CF70